MRIQFRWWWDGGTSSTNLELIWEISVQCIMTSGMSAEPSMYSVALPKIIRRSRLWVYAPITRSPASIAFDSERSASPVER